MDLSLYELESCYEKDYSSSRNGCAFFEKLDIETNYPATAYLWDQDDVVGIIILPGTHEPENLDLCVLEKHEL